MQIKFLNIYDYLDIDISQVQYELLGFWRDAIAKDQINLIQEAKVEFKEYTFAEYPDQEKLIKQLRQSVTSGYDAYTSSHFWVANKVRYSSFDELYDNLAKTHRLVELTITPDD